MGDEQRSCRAAGTPLEIRWLGTVDYQDAWQMQRELAERRADDTDAGTDTLLLLEHPPVYTAGKRTSDDERPSDGTPVIDVDRGGKLTWHGKGQLVGYPIVGLADPIDVVDYVRRLEQALISVCDSLGVPTGRIEGRSGVWLAADEHRQERKIAAIGIRVQRGVTMHGFSINCDCDLSAYGNGIACGIRDAGATSLSAELGRDVQVAEVTPLATAAVTAALDGSLPVTERPVRRSVPQAAGVRFVLST
ncbi:MAG: lipoyl(octanoyl) transferase LipB [Sciscionella sp.]